MNPGMELSQEQQDQVLDALASGALVAEVAKTLGVEQTTLYRYKRRHPAFAALWDAALTESCDTDMDRIRDMAMQLDTTTDKLATVQASRALETRFKILSWYVQRRAPAKYGDRLDLNIKGTLDMRAVLVNATARLEQLAHSRALRLPDVTSPALSAGLSHAVAGLSRSED